MIKSLEFCSSETALKLSNLEQKLFSMSWDASIIEQKINDKSFKYWIYEDENEIIGYLGIQFIHHDIEILGIGVLEEYSKKGVATELMDLLISYFETSKYEKKHHHSFQCKHILRQLNLRSSESFLQLTRLP